MASVDERSRIKVEEDEEQRLRERLKRRQERRRQSRGSGDPDDHGDPHDKHSRDDDDDDDDDDDEEEDDDDSADDDSHYEKRSSDSRSGKHRRDRDHHRHRERHRHRRGQGPPLPPPGRYPPPPYHYHPRGPPRGPPYRGGPDGPRWERAGPSPFMRGYYDEQWRRGPPMPPRGGPPPSHHWRGPPVSRDRNPRYPPPRRSRSQSYSSRSRSRGSRSRSVSSSRSRSRSTSRSRGRRSHHASRSRSYSVSSRSRSSDDDSRSGKASSSSSEDESPLEEEPDSALTKDQRTVFVSQLVMRAEEKDLRKYFRKKVECRVNEVIMLRDKRTGRHKGCAYVELGRLEDVPKAVAVSGQPPDFQRFPILVKASEAEKNYIIPNTQTTLTASMMGAAASNSPLVGPNGKLIEAQKVYLGNLDPKISQEQIYTMFSKFGHLDKVAIQMDPTSGTSRGFAFLSYRDPKDANLAIQTMSGQMLGNRPLKTGWANQTASVAGVEVVTSTEFPDDAPSRIQSAHVFLAQLAGSALSGTGVFDDDPNAAETMVPVTNSVATASPDAKVIGNSDNPTNTLLVHNMFNKDEETDEGWEEDIRLDFEEECSKYGKLLLVKVMSNEPGGKIYASFEDINEAKNCASNLAGRWFDKRQLQVEFVSENSIPQ